MSHSLNKFKYLSKTFSSLITTASCADPTNDNDDDGNDVSEELIEDWSLVTKDDLSILEERCDTACESIDDLEKRFNDYQTHTDDNIADLDKRLKDLEGIDEE